MGEQCIMKRFIPLVFAAALTATSSAERTQQTFIGDNRPVSLKKGELFDILYAPQHKNVKNGARATRSGSNSVTVKLDYDPELYFIQTMQLCGQERHTTFVMGENEIVFDGVSQGEYWLICPFSNTAAPDEPGNFLVIKKIYVFDGEFCSTVVRPSDATQLVEFRSVLPDGSEPVLPSTTEADKNYRDRYDRSNANIAEMARFAAIGQDDIGTCFYFVSNQPYTTVERTYNKNTLDIKVTPLDETWHFSAAKWMKTEDDRYYFTFSSTNGTSQQPAVNEPDFREWEYSFADNPVNHEFDTPPSHYGVNLHPVVNGRISAMGFIIYGEQNPRLFFSAPKPADTSGWESTYAVELKKVEYDVDIVSDWGSMPDIRSIGSPLMTWDSETGGVRFSAGGSSLHGSPLWWNIDDLNPLFYPGHPSFCSAAADARHPLGESAPLAVATMQAYRDNPWYLGFSVTNMGLYGEGRGADSALTEAFISTPDDEVVCDMDDFDKEFSRLLSTGKLGGEFTIDIINDRNIAVDGIKGYNRLSVKVADGSGEDVCPPTFTMMQLRDKQGIVENVFDTPADGTIELTGGDMNMTEEVNTHWLCEAPKSVKVEYAPAGSDDFREIAVEEIADNYLMPEFGHFWRGSLGDIDVKSEGGWFQLRLSMSDEAGNTHTQTLYPAFRIKSLSGIESVTSDEDGHAPVYYNLQGIQTDSPSSGIYIRIRNGKATKEVIR